jgi:hypothetical protein
MIDISPQGGARYLTQSAFAETPWKPEAWSIAIFVTYENITDHEMSKGI